MNTQSSHDNQNETVPLLPHYVYVLMEPINKVVFYVGKGTGNRVQAHVVEAVSKSEGDLDLDNPKLDKIQEILDAGHKPIELVVARFKTEAEAFAVEATLIQWVYGFSNLTNLVLGHGSDLIRSKDDYEPSPGLDVPKPLRRNDGVFKDKNLLALEQSGATDLLEQLTTRLISEAFQVRDFSAASDRPYDPGMSNGWLGLIVRINSVDFMLNFSKTCKIGLYVANTQFSRSEEAKLQLQKIEQKLGEDYSCSKPLNNKVKSEGRYRAIGKGPDFATASRHKFSGENLDAIVAFLHTLKKIKHDS